MSTIILFWLGLNVLVSVYDKKYIGYTKISQCYTRRSWVYFSWNYVGGCKPKRHIGVRWFGFEFEHTKEIPMGELRF